MPRRLRSRSARPSRTTKAPGPLARGAFAFSWFALIWLAACTPPSYFATRAGQGVSLARNAYADELVARAQEKKLADSKGWLALGHYRPDPLNARARVRSEADGTAFFLAPTGKFDPAAELEATIRAVLAPAAAQDAKTLDNHPACRFPARVMFLVSELGLDLDKLGTPACPGFEKYLADVRPASITLIFTSYYLNNPASAFGHTFLRINKSDRFEAGKRRELLDYGIDFSADVTTENPVLYAFMGITGMFQGTFKRLPYYYKVREYNDVESRDLWEYELALEPAQRFQLVAHIWEVGKTHFDYFYLGENCSYHILGLIAVARPELDLLEKVTSPVVPAQTVQVLDRQPGLVRGKHHRPSLRTQFEARIEPMSARLRRLVGELADAPSTRFPADLSRADQVSVLDAALDLVDVRYADELLFEREGEGAKKKQVLLERRSSILVPSPSFEASIPKDKAPELGHGPRRIGLSGGYDARENPFVGAAFRLALHDLADPTDGFPELAQIEFLSIRARFSDDEGRLRIQLDQADVMRVRSLSSLERFDKHASFQVAAGARSVDDRGCRDCYAGRFLAGGGFAKAFAREAVALFVLGDAHLLVGPPFRAHSPVPIRAGAGPSGGLRLRITRDLVFLAEGMYVYWPEQLPVTTWQVDGTLRYQFVRDWALSAEARMIPQGPEGQLFVLSYF